MGDYQELKKFVFAETPKLSNYLWTLNVGQYVMTVCDDFKFPIRFLARKN